MKNIVSFQIPEVFKTTNLPLIVAAVGLHSVRFANFLWEFIVSQANKMYWVTYFGLFRK